MEEFKVILRRIGEDPKISYRLSSIDGSTRGLETIRERRPPPASSGYVTVRLCETENRRQQGHYHLDRMIAAEAGRPDPDDKLPIVELRPFTQKEWRPAKSVPHSGIERTHSSLSAHSAPGAFEYENHGYPNPDKSVTTPRGTDCAPCPKAAAAYPGDRQSAHPRHRDSGVSVPADYGVGFATKPERERSTVGEIRSGQSTSAHYSCNKLALTDTDLQQQQRMRVSGRKINELPPKISTMYYDPWDYYKLARSTELAQTSAEIINNVYLGVSGSQALLDENIYDAFDRSKTLPSIKVRRAPLRRRAPQPPNQHHRGSARLSQKPAYRLGVTNSLDLLSHYGTPIGVEQQLSHELRLTIDHMRKTKNHASAIGGAFKIVPKYYEFSPTYGEKRIKSGIRHNAGGRKSVSASGTSGVGSEKYERLAHTAQEVGPAKGGWMSRATTYMDSGIDSLPGSKSPTKSVQGPAAPGGGRVLSSKLQMYAGFPGERENIEIPSMRPVHKTGSPRDLRKAESADKLHAPAAADAGGEGNADDRQMSDINETEREAASAVTKGNSNGAEKKEDEHPPDQRGEGFDEETLPDINSTLNGDACGNDEAQGGDEAADGGNRTRETGNTSLASSISVDPNASLLAPSPGGEPEAVDNADNVVGEVVTIPTESDTNINGEPPAAEGGDVQPTET